MPKKVFLPGSFCIVSHGGNTIDLCECLAGKNEFPKVTILKFIADEQELSAERRGAVCIDAQRIYAAIEESEPLLLRSPDIYLFGKQVWSISKTEQTYNEEQLRLVFLEALDADREKWERLKRKFSGVAGEAVEYTREPIPQSVRIFVWRRDEGKCVQCGSNQKLEYDHILPLSKGGSNTERNIQLLCEKCNRSKSAKI